MSMPKRTKKLQCSVFRYMSLCMLHIHASTSWCIYICSMMSFFVGYTRTQSNRYHRSLLMCIHLLSETLQPHRCQMFTMVPANIYVFCFCCFKFFESILQMSRFPPIMIRLYRGRRQNATTDTGQKKNQTIECCCYLQWFIVVIW